MVTLCVGTLLLGAMAAAALPFFPFMIAVVVAIVLGAVTASLRGHSAAIVGEGALGVICFAQFGYAAGLATTAGLLRWRDELVRVKLASLDVLFRQHRK